MEQQVRKIAILVNPLSGNGKAIKIGRWLSVQLHTLRHDSSLYSGNWPQIIEGYSEIWLVGGDGTVNYFLNHYPHNNLPLAFFKGGTGNDIAWRLYGDTTLEQQLEKVLHALPRPVDAGTCNGILFINSCGIGFDGDVLKSMRVIRGLGGHLGYLAVVINKIFTFKEPYFSIETKCKKVSDRFLLLIINNSSRSGGGFMVTPKASVNDGKLDLLLCKPLSIWQRLRYLPVIKKGNHLGLPFIDYSLEEIVQIQCKHPLNVQLDGELICATSLELRILPGKLLVKY